MAITSIPLPAAVQSASERLYQDGFYFVPIRHHSPACAYALKQLIGEVRPVAVLIEGPETFTDSIPLLLHQQTSPPVAVLAQATGKELPDLEGPSQDTDGKPKTVTRSAFFPFCDYSPEWIALREGALAGAQLAFIDLPWTEQAWHGDGRTTDADQSLMAERYLAHSRYLNALATNAGCRSHDELWDHLFELRTRAELCDWRALFADVFAYCAMARLDYEPEVLEAEGSLPRERHMARQIRDWRSRVTGPVVVVTGGFHTMELVLGSAAERCAVAREKSPGAADKAKEPAEQWLIRYSFDRLDALNGYGSGMPSPAYYQGVWQSLLGNAPEHLTTVAADFLSQMACTARGQKLSEFISTADVQAALLQAVRLAALRGHAGPGRQDLLDATFSCFVKGAIDDGTVGLVGDVRKILGGSLVGDIPPSAGSPPLLEDARRAARRCGVLLDDSSSRSSRLDLYRKPGHRKRSRFFHLMAYLETDLASWQSGPDFLNDQRLDLLFEEWHYAWTPVVEARLIGLSDRGTTLTEVALSRLRAEEAALAGNGQCRSAASASTLLVRACLIGLHERLPTLFPVLREHLDQDTSFASVVACGHRLVTLWRAREPLGVQGLSQIEELLQQVWPAALFLMSDLDYVDEGKESGVIQHLLSLRALGRVLQTWGAEGAGPDLTLFHQQLSRFTRHADVAPGICGAASAILFIDGYWGEAALKDLILGRFGAGADPEAAVRCLLGVMSAAPELLTTIPSLMAALHSMVSQWDESTFVAYLPDLRLAFSYLKPQETAAIAELIAGVTGLKAQEFLQCHYEATEQDLFTGIDLQLQLGQSLHNDGLLVWVSETEPA